MKSKKKHETPICEGRFWTIRSTGRGFTIIFLGPRERQLIACERKEERAIRLGFDFTQLFWWCVAICVGLLVPLIVNGQLSHHRMTVDTVSYLSTNPFMHFDALGALYLFSLVIICAILISRVCGSIGAKYNTHIKKLIEARRGDFTEYYETCLHKSIIFQIALFIPVIIVLIAMLSGSYIQVTSRGVITGELSGLIKHHYRWSDVTDVMVGVKPVDSGPENWHVTVITKDGCTHGGVYGRHYAECAMEYIAVKSGHEIEWVPEQ